MFNISVFQQKMQTRGRNIPDAAVVRAFDVATSDDVPKRNFIAEQHLFFPIDIGGNGIRFSEMGDDFPEPILGVSVVKFLFSGGHRRKSPQNEYCRFFIKNR